MWMGQGLVPMHPDLASTRPGTIHHPGSSCTTLLTQTDGWAHLGGRRLGMSTSTWNKLTLKATNAISVNYIRNSINILIESRTDIKGKDRQSLNLKSFCASRTLDLSSLECIALQLKCGTALIPCCNVDYAWTEISQSSRILYLCWMPFLRRWEDLAWSMIN